jgi:hypothetical protein
VHYSAFLGERTKDAGGGDTLWVVVRPHNWHPEANKEHLLQLHAITGG